MPSEVIAARPQIHVGIVGHRPNRLPKDIADLTALRGTIRSILQAIDAAIQPESVCAVTSLAEGADRIFAEEALALGFALCCPLPFVQAEFEKDFLPPAALEPSSLMHFRALLEQARRGPGLTVQELKGSRAEAPEAYAAAGRAMLDQSDILLGVWDGGDAAGHGGTAETLREGLGRHIPVFWIDTHTPENWTLLCRPADLVPKQDETLRPAGRDLGETVAQLIKSLSAR